MNGDDHTGVGRVAFDSLPEWEREVIQPDMSEPGLNRPYFPSGLQTVREKMACLCTVMDLVYYDECRPYATLPDGRWIPHSLPRDDSPDNGPLLELGVTLAHQTYSGGRSNGSLVSSHQDCGGWFFGREAHCTSSALDGVDSASCSASGFEPGS